MNVFRELRRRQAFGRVIRVAVVGTGAMGRGIAGQLQRMPGMTPAILVNRTVERAVQVWIELGVAKEDIVISDDPRTLSVAVEKGAAAVSRDSCVAAAVKGIEVVIEATGTLMSAARTALSAIHCGKHVVVMNAALDATVGCYLCERARQQGVVYSYADGSGPGSLMRLVEGIQGLGFELLVGGHCVESIDVYATPNARELSVQGGGSSAGRVCAVRDGTQLNLESAVVANATGLFPQVRGMVGLRTTRGDAVADFGEMLHSPGVLDYTWGGDFGGGVFAIGRCNGLDSAGHNLDMLRMGPGPDYLFQRPYHLGCFEVPLTVVEAVLFREPALAPRGAPLAEVIAIAKRDLKAGEILDGIGGGTLYGQIERATDSVEFLPIGLSEGLRLNTSVSKGDPIPGSAVDVDGSQYMANLRHLQAMLFPASEPTTSHALPSLC